MGKNRHKTITAGRLVYAVCYSQATAADEPAARQAKTRVSSRARQLINFRAAWQKLELLIAANFDRDDWFLTLTFDARHLPADRDGARKAAQAFLRRLRSQRGMTGRDVKYVYCVEEMPDEPDEDGRLHLHMILNAAGERPEEIEALWKCGHCLAEPLLSGPQDGYEARARYIVKERHPGAKGRKTGLRAWNASRNLKKPEVESVILPDSVTITAPPGAYVLDSHGEQNAFGSYSYIKYLLPPRITRHRRT